MNFLKDKRVYLSGPIENALNNNWRNFLIEKLKDFSLNVFDPASDPKQQWADNLKRAREEKDFNTMAKIAKDFVRKDLSLVDRADFIICNLPYKIATYGTCEELVTAARAKKPCLLICEKGKEFIPFWFYGYIPHEQMFGNWDSLLLYLKEVNEGLHKNNYIWSYIYGLI